MSADGHRIGSAEDDALRAVLDTPAHIRPRGALANTLSFASNIYVDPATMPAWLQGFVRINPVALLVTAIRGLMNGKVTLAQLGWAVFAPAVIATVCAPLTMWLYRRKR
ncbi:ABC transporter permease [Algiphilus sp. W345]|uniref:ABC transporter permease n=1 Tax=Banduia mediterranea TaxID=3075609 RepID=A0ABU2WM99_9GAMM|nr:ABC transporter permease [Algiphilus sp. W345]MDT0499009.1 ABC transporter permease [Algiphilus sp. W345]